MIERRASYDTERQHYTLTAAEAQDLPGRILAVLVECRAQKRRITGKQLAARFGYRDDRKVRVAIGKLILKGHIILSSTRGVKGYFLSDSSAEVNEYVTTQISRIREDYERVKAIRANAAKAIEGVHQLPLALDLSPNSTNGSIEFGDLPEEVEP